MLIDLNQIEDLNKAETTFLILDVAREDKYKKNAEIQLIDNLYDYDTYDSYSLDLKKGINLIKLDENLEDANYLRLDLMRNTDDEVSLNGIEFCVFRTRFEYNKS